MGAVRHKESRALYEDVISEPHKKELPERSELLPASPLYPRQLLELADVPGKLYTLGDIRVLNTSAIAIVGARKATSYGLECARRFACKAAALGITVVSGGAIGCDMAAHQGALDAGGKTVVVLGSGADVVYPLRARSLFKEVLVAGGVLLSEAPWGSAPLAWAFSKRNRIIAALARATLIVEAGLPSGTFQTADHTLALGNEVLVVPGPIFSKESKGSNRLLVQGALPIVNDDSFEDALKQIFGSSLEQAMPPVNEIPLSPTVPADGSVGGFEVSEEAASLKPQEIILRQLREHILKDVRANPMTIYELARARGKEVMEVVRIVTKLEIGGQVIRLRDGRYMAKPG